MQSWQFGSAVLAGVVLAASVSGCAPQGAPRPPAGDSRLKVYSEHRLISSEQWEVYQPEEHSAMASIVAVARNGSVGVLCDGKGGLSIHINSHDGRELKAPSIEVSFDQATPSDYSWVTIPPAEDGWGFGLVDDQKDFQPAIAALKQHETLEAVVSESGKDWRRYQFTLAKAEEAIDYVVKLCGKSS
jgi:hypothetical protein